MTNAPNPNDAIDRKQMKPSDKLDYICDKAREQFQRDPRAGGFVFVAQPHVVQAALYDLNNETGDRFHKLERPVVFQPERSDVVMTWKRIDFRVRHSVIDDNVWCIPLEMMQPSMMADRRVASELRMEAHRGEITIVEDMSAVKDMVSRKGKATQALMNGPSLVDTNGRKVSN